MSVVLTLKWPGATKEQYDKLLELVDWENEPARNGIFHVVWFEGDGMGIVDVGSRSRTGRASWTSGLLATFRLSAWRASRRLSSTRCTATSTLKRGTQPRS